MTIALDTARLDTAPYAPCVRLDKPQLSPREVEVLRDWLRSDSKAALAVQMYLSVGTINTYLARVRAKYAAVGRPATTKTKLLARALQDGIVTLADFP